MPLAFPSHQGLIAPLWRRWPGRFSAVACSIGAAAPDIVDGAAGILRGRLGQSYGHSLLGLFVVCLPVGVLLTLVARVRTSAKPPLGKIALSVGIGALSHLVFDLVSHDNFPLLLPWYQPRHVFPDWWTTRWFEVTVPGYHDYPIGPHFVVWVVLSVAGAVMFFRKRPTAPTLDTPPPPGSV